jgi:prevent-host-death family protein
LLDKGKLRDYNCSYIYKEYTEMKFVGVRELKNKTTEVLAYVNKNEKVIVTKRGKPIATIAALKEEEIEQFIIEGKNWLNLSESSFRFWDNEEDEIWNEV